MPNLPVFKQIGPALTMLIKPEIEDETIIACIRQEYGLRIVQLVFLPLGGDLCTAVYRVVEEDGTPFFCKLRCADFEEISVELPQFLSGQGIAEIIPPLVTNAGHLWAELGKYKIILYPFIEGTSGFEIKLTADQWTAFGTALKRVHTISVPPAISRKIQRESFSSEWRDQCRNVIKRLDEETFDDPITAGFAAFVQPKRETFIDLLERAERLAETLVSRTIEFVLCHTDIHPGNLFIESKGTLYIVDWDYPMLAPKERDLMFIGGGQGYKDCSEQEEEMHFYQNYGETTIDLDAMAYYRCERNIIDLCVESGRIFSSTLSDQDRAQSLEIVTWLFLPGGSIDMAYKAVKNQAGARI
jgi:spectinomycin phosphotransferase